MATSSSPGTFESVNPEWHYSVRLSSEVVLHFAGEQSAWRCELESSYTLKPESVLAVLNDALARGCKVVAFNTVTRSSLCLQGEKPLTDPGASLADTVRAAAFNN